MLRAIECNVRLGKKMSTPSQNTAYPEVVLDGKVMVEIRLYDRASKWTTNKKLRDWWKFHDKSRRTTHCLRIRDYLDYTWLRLTPQKKPQWSKLWRVQDYLTKNLRQWVRLRLKAYARHSCRWVCRIEFGSADVKYCICRTILRT